MRPIDADALFKTVNRKFYSAFEVGSKDSENGRFRRGYNVAITDACEAITAAPTLSPDEVRGVGEWLTEYEPNGRPYQFHCSVCDSDFSQMGITHASNYCPSCGARMEVSEDA